MEKVALLNNDYTFISFIDWKRSICLMLRGKVEPIKNTKRIISNPSKTVQLFVPAVVKLCCFISEIYKRRVKFTKKSIMLRDNHTCCYCGSKENLTIDHVLPISRGGKNSFDNCVTSCFKCNNSKGNRTPEEANLKLIRKPFTPSIFYFFNLKEFKNGL